MDPIWKGIAYEKQGNSWLKRYATLNLEGSLEFYKEESSKRPFQTFMITYENSFVEQKTATSSLYNNSGDKNRSHSVVLTTRFQMQLSGENLSDTKNLFNALKAVITRRKMDKWWWEEKVMPILSKSGALNLEQNYDKILADYLEEIPSAMAESKPLTSNVKSPSAENTGGFQNARNLFTEAAIMQKVKLEKNPFSNQYKGPANFDTNAADYGRPEEGSLTALRGQNAHKWVDTNIEKLVEVIKNNGKFDNTTEGFSIKFADLFHVYAEVSDTLVGILQRAKRRKVLHFPGDMLFQGASDGVVITIIDEKIDSHYGKLEKLSGAGTKLGPSVDPQELKGNLFDGPWSGYETLSTDSSQLATES